MKLLNKYTLLLVMAFVTTNLCAREITGQEAQQKIKGAEKIIVGTKSEIPEFVQFRTEAQVPYSDFNFWAHNAFKLSDDYGFKLLSVSDKHIKLLNWKGQCSWCM